MPTPFSTVLLVLAVLVCIFASSAVGITLAVLALVLEGALPFFAPAP